MLIYKNIIINNTKFIYYLQKILKSNNTYTPEMLFFVNGFSKYIIEDIMIKINKTNSLLNDYKLVYYYIENNFYNFNLYSKMLYSNQSLILHHFKKAVYNELLLKINNELNKYNYMFIVNNMLLFNNIIKNFKYHNIKEIIILKKKF